MYKHENITNSASNSVEVVAGAELGNNSYKKTVCILRFSPAPLDNVTESGLFKGFPNLTFVFYQFLIVEKVVQGKNS